MLRIYPVLLNLMTDLQPALGVLNRRDPDLARQCRRALSSGALNLAEGSYNRGKNRAARYHTAAGSVREALACFEVAAALGYMPLPEPNIRARFDHVIGTLINRTVRSPARWTEYREVRRSAAQLNLSGGH